MRRMHGLKRLSGWLLAIALLLPGLSRAENYSDHWWNPGESGWGVTIADHDTQLFAVWYVYDTDGSPIWFVVPGGTFNANRTFFSGDVYRTTGPSFAGATFDPAAVTRTKVGTAAFDFAPAGAPAGTAVFSYSIAGASGSKRIERMPFGSASPLWGFDRTDLWWNADESGWGLSLVQQGDNVFGAWFTYASSGRPLFIVMPGVTMTSRDEFTGTLYTTTGPAYNAATFDPAQVRRTPVGVATLRFTGDTGTFTATVQGVTVVKTITRQPFGAVGRPPQPADPKRVEENTAGVSFSAGWRRAEATWGWSGGSAMQSTTAGATASITFTGTSIRLIGARGRGHGIAALHVDGVFVREVNLYAAPTDEIHTPIATIHDLAPGQHTLTITVTGRRDNQALGNVVVVDAFDIQPDTTVSHWQDTNPEMQYSRGWTKSSNSFPWSGSGVSNLPELPVTAQETEAAGETLTLPFRGTGVSWIGYRGPDGGIAEVRIDGAAPTEVDLYSPIATFQPIVFTTVGLADGTHTLTITATGRKNAASRAARVVVDAIDVVTPGRRYEDHDPSITYAGPPGPTAAWTLNRTSRVWTEGSAATSNRAGSTATFRFNGTSVSWIGCRKGSAGGTADIFIDGAFVQQVRLSETYPIEGYQVTVFRADGLAPGPHTLEIKVVNTNGSYVVVDAFDVR